MDRVLEERYLALFQGYGIKRRRDLAMIKQRLLGLVLEHLLRPDAALCLLTLYDQMIVRPYAAPVRSRRQDEEITTLPIPEIGRNKDQFAGKILQSFTVILEQIMTVHERPISSHQVLRAIDRAWPTLSEIFGWG
jgi:hypothetical protein